MSKQLTFSAAFCALTMALFAIAGDRSPPSGMDLHGAAPLVSVAGMER